MICVGSARARVVGLAGVLLLVPLLAWARVSAPTPGPSTAGLEIWLVTVSPGDDIASRFGHTVLWVRNRGSGRERIYSYGLFDFGPKMLPQFLTGRLWFRAGELPPASVFEDFRVLAREVRAQRLDLPPDRRLEMVRALEWTVRPENRRYLYDHYFDNCTTRVRDLLDRSTGGELRRQSQDQARLTLRDHTRRYIQSNPVLDIVLNLWMSAPVDAPITRWEEMFLPAELELAVDRLRVASRDGTSKPLVAERVVIHSSSRPPVPDEPNEARYLYGAAALLAGGSFVALARRHEVTRSRRSRIALGLTQATIGAVLGLPGLIVVLSWFTNHTLAYWNQNVCFANPVTFALLPLGLAVALGSERAGRWTHWSWSILGASTMIGLGLEMVPGIAQANGEVVASYAVFNLIVASGMLWRDRTALLLLDQCSSMRTTSLVAFDRIHASRWPSGDHSKTDTCPAGKERRY
jgi:hypothetical protein